MKNKKMMSTVLVGVLSASMLVGCDTKEVEETEINDTQIEEVQIEESSNFDKMKDIYFIEKGAYIVAESKITTYKYRDYNSDDWKSADKCMDKFVEAREELEEIEEDISPEEKELFNTLWNFTVNNIDMVRLYGLDEKEQLDAKYEENRENYRTLHDIFGE